MHHCITQGLSQPRMRHFIYTLAFTFTFSYVLGGGGGGGGLHHALIVACTSMLKVIKNSSTSMSCANICAKGLMAVTDTPVCIDAALAVT